MYIYIYIYQVSNANIYMYKQFYISNKTHGLYCHNLIFCKWVNLRKTRHQYESQDEKLTLNLQVKIYFPKWLLESKAEILDDKQ